MKNYKETGAIRTSNLSQSKFQPKIFVQFFNINLYCVINIVHFCCNIRFQLMLVLVLLFFFKNLLFYTLS